MFRIRYNLNMATKSLGDCYYANAKFLADHVEREEEAEWVLCHGTVTNPAGESIGHCWLERHGTAFDFANGRQLAYRADEYRRVVKALDVRVYTPEEVSINIIRHGHYGPWQ
jgi:hypothetical protein